MKIKQLQEKIRQSENPFKSAAEIMLAITEEVGEVAQEVALLEKVGTKAHWKIEPSKERLGKEVSNLLNCIVGLANHYDIDIESEYKE